LRQITDLDVLVKRRQLDDVMRLLPAHGYSYQQSLPDRTAAAERRVFYNHVFIRGHVTVEVHWKFSQDFFPFDIDYTRLWRRLSRVTIFGQPVEALHAEDLILVLCVHGARHCWERLAWIVDLAHLIARHPEIDLQQILAEARERGVERAVA